MFWLPIPLPSTVIPRYLNLSTCLTKALSLINTSNFGIYHQVFCFFEADFQSPFFVFFIYMQNWEIHVVILVNMNSMSQESCAKATWSSAKFNLNRWDSRIGKPIGTNWFACIYKLSSWYVFLRSMNVQCNSWSSVSFFFPVHKLSTQGRPGVKPLCSSLINVPMSCLSLLWINLPVIYLMSSLHIDRNLGLFCSLFRTAMKSFQFSTLLVSFVVLSTRLKDVLIFATFLHPYVWLAQLSALHLR